MIEKAHWQNWAEAARASPEFAVEQAKLDFALAIERCMDRSQVTRAQLARMLGTSGAAVTVALRGDANLTIERMVRMADALDSTVHIHIAPKAAGVRWFETFTSVARDQKNNAAAWARQATSAKHGQPVVSAA